MEQRSCSSGSQTSSLSLKTDRFPVSRGRARAIYGFALIIHFLLAIDTTSVAVALPTIARDLNATDLAIFSLGTVFLLAATVFQPVITELSHVVGRKPAFMLVLLVFAAGSVVAALARSLTMLLVGRAMQGFASGGSGLSGIILTDIVPLRERATWMPVQNAVWAVGLVCGPLIGAGLLTVSWSWLFWMNLPPILVAAIGLSCLLGFDMPEGTTLRSIKELDWLGIAIFIPSTIAMLAPPMMAGMVFPWLSASAVCPMTVGMVGFLCLGAQQRYMAKNPMFRPSLFTRRVAACGFISSAVSATCLCLIFYYIAVFWIGVRNFSTLSTGVALLPETIGIPIAAIMTGVFIQKTGQIQWASWVGWPLSTVAIGLFWFMDISTPLYVLITINLLAGIGCGIVAPAVTMTVLSTTDEEDAGHAMATISVIRAAGQCLGVAIGAAVFNAQVQVYLRQLGHPDVNPERVMRVLTELKDHLDVRKALVEALRALWWICCGLSAFSTILCCWYTCPRLSHDRHLPGSGGKVSLQDED